jgi:hypothetical protein
METQNNQNYGQGNRDFNNQDNLIEEDKRASTENIQEEDLRQDQEEFIDDVNHQTNDFNRYENLANEPILNREDQITNDLDPDEFDDADLEEDGDLDDEDLEDDDDDLDDVDEDLNLSEVSHDPFPGVNPDRF